MPNNTNAAEIRSLEAQISSLAAKEHLVATNDGTYGSSEAARATGNGDPAWNTWRLYETVGGAKRWCWPQSSADVASYPGRTRHLSGDEMAADRARLAQLRADLRKLSR